MAAAPGRPGSARRGAELPGTAPRTRLPAPRCRPRAARHKLSAGRRGRVAARRCPGTSLWRSRGGSGPGARRAGTGGSQRRRRKRCQGGRPSPPAGHPSAPPGCASPAAWPQVPPRTRRPGGQTCRGGGRGVRGRAGVAAGQGWRGGVGRAAVGLGLLLILWLLKLGAGPGPAGVPGSGGAARGFHGGGGQALPPALPLPRRISVCADKPLLRGGRRSRPLRSCRLPRGRCEARPRWPSGPGRRRGRAGGAVLSGGEETSPPRPPTSRAAPGRLRGPEAALLKIASSQRGGSRPARGGGEAAPGEEGSPEEPGRLPARPPSPRPLSHAGHLEAAVPRRAVVWLSRSW